MKFFLSAFTSLLLVLVIKQAHADVTISGTVRVEIQTPFTLRGVDSITGQSNGFLSIAPSLSSSSLSGFNSFSGSTTAFSLGSSSFTTNSYGAANFSVNSFISNNAESGSLLLQSFSSASTNNSVDFSTTSLTSTTILGSSSNAFTFMPQATFATFNTYTSISSEKDGLDLLDLVTKNITTIGLRTRWEDSSGTQLYPSLSTSTVGANTTTTISLTDRNSTTHDWNTNGAAKLVFDNNGSVIDYLHPATNSSITALSSSGSLALVSSNVENTSYIFSPFDIKRVAIFPSSGTSRFVDISGNGTKVAGINFSEGYGLSLSSGITIGSSGISGFILDDDGTLTELGNYQSTNTCNGVGSYDCSIYSLGIAPTSISSDGTTVVGGALMMDRGALAIGDLVNAMYTGGFYWNSASGINLLGDLSGSNKFSIANATNEDGSVIVGTSESSSGMEAFRWTAASGMTALGDLSGGGFHSVALDVSNDGSKVIGYGNVGSNNSLPLYEGFLWQSATGMVGLGRPSTSASSMALAISGDGNVVVGTQGDLESKSVAAFRWTSSNGRELVTDWLTNTGVSLPAGYTLNTATTVNNDGTIIGGTTNTESWIAIAGRGVIYPDSFTPSLISPVSITDQSLSLFSLSLEGAHHIPLKTLQLKKDHCFWVNGDGADKDSDHTRTSLFEIGGCSDISNSARFGLGIGKSFTSKDIHNLQDHSLNGTYIYSELGLTPYSDNVVFTLSALEGNWKSSLGRYYPNAGAYDLSTGTPDIHNRSVKLRADYLNAFSYADFSITPSVSYTQTKTHIDSYTEAGGGFPAQFDEQTKRTTELRLGLSAVKKIENGTLRILLDRYKELSRDNSNISGEVIDWMYFDLEDTSKKQDRNRFGVEFDKKLDNDLIMSVLVSSSSTGDYIDKAAAISFKYGF